MFDFVDDQNTKYNEAALKVFLNEKNALATLRKPTGKPLDLHTVMY